MICRGRGNNATKRTKVQSKNQYITDTTKVNQVNDKCLGAVIARNAYPPLPLKCVDASYHSNGREKLNDPSSSFFAVFFSSCPRFLSLLGLGFVHCLRHTGNLKISKVPVPTIVAMHSKVEENRHKKANAEHAQIQSSEDRPPRMNLGFVHCPRIHTFS